MRRFLLPLIPLLLLTPFLPQIDLACSGYFFDGVGFQETPLLRALFIYGPIFSYVATLLGMVALVVGRWRREAALFVLTLALGSGLLVNGILKPGWGRPRPRQIVEFGGSQAYRAWYNPNLHPPEPSLSFPSGHAAAGFYFFSLVALGRQLQRRWVRYLGYTMVTILGSLLAYCRIAMGGHYFSDILWSGYLMWLVVALLERILFEGEAEPCLD